MRCSNNLRSTPRLWFPTLPSPPPASAPHTHTHTHRRSLQFLTHFALLLPILKWRKAAGMMKGSVRLIGPTCLLRSLIDEPWLIYPLTTRLGAIDLVATSNHRLEAWWKCGTLSFGDDKIKWARGSLPFVFVSFCSFLCQKNSTKILTFVHLSVEYCEIIRAADRNTSYCAHLGKLQLKRRLVH